MAEPCATHWQFLQDAIAELGASDRIKSADSTQQAQLVTQFQDDSGALLDAARYDPLLTLLFYVTTFAAFVQKQHPKFLTPDGQVEGCPLCIHRNDVVIAKYLRSVAADVTKLK